MNEQMRAGMAEATRLTQAGKLLEATALIQRTLRGALAPDLRDEPQAQPDGDIIEGTFWVNDPALPSPPAALPPSERSSGEPPRPTQPSPPAPPARPITHSTQPPQAKQGTTPPLDAVVGRSRVAAGTGGQFVSGSYTDQAGTRSYKLYIPSGYQGQPLPLVVMLHGCTQTPDDFAAGTRMNTLAEAHSCLVLYPAQASAANRSRCWNWFKAADQQRGRGEPSLIAGMTRQICRSYAVDPRRIYVAGLSAGGAMAVILGVTYPDLYAAIGNHSGLAYGAAHDLPSALAAMSQGGKVVSAHRKDRIRGSEPYPSVVPMILFHGDRDTTVHPRNAEHVIAQWAALHADGRPATAAGSKPRVSVQQGQVPSGHAYNRAIYHDASGQVIVERWVIHGANHAWSGGSTTGSFTDSQGPDATREMLRFFLAHPRREA